MGLKASLTRWRRRGSLIIAAPFGLFVILWCSLPLVWGAFKEAIREEWRQ